MDKADFFISHASEDKDNFVRELANYLMLNGAFVFYDEYSIKLGDSLTESINKGISNSNHAILVLSKYFFEKSWTNAELQSLFNKSMRENFKILIIYHEVNHSEVAEKYPLLADIKGINSSEGIDKISNELFNAINKKQNLAYITNEFKRDNDKISEGFSISLFVGFPNFNNQNFEKVLFELGKKNQFHSRLRLIYQRDRIFFEIIDSFYHKFSISADISNWRVGEQFLIHADLNFKEKKIFLFIDDKIVDSMIINDIFIDENSFNNSTGIIGNSLELTNPCQFIIATNFIGKSFSDVNELLKLGNIIKQYLKDIQQ